MLKRAIDILAASVLLTVSLPMLIIAGVLVRTDSAGPAIFRQERMGRRFRRFQLYKLRTMKWSVNGSAYTLGADPRITPIGRWLRRFKIDELPQLWNVLRGDMSIVGPRPVIPELTMEFDCAYRKLLTVRPGLTDPASLKYCHEAEMLSRVEDPLTYFKTVVTPDKVRISQDYLERATLWTDLLIVIRTLLALAGLPWKLRLRRPVLQPIPGFTPFPQTVKASAPQTGFSHSAANVQFEASPAVAQRSSLP